MCPADWLKLFRVQCLGASGSVIRTCHWSMSWHSGTCSKSFMSWCMGRIVPKLNLISQALLTSKKVLIFSERRESGWEEDGVGIVKKGARTNCEWYVNKMKKMLKNIYLFPGCFRTVLPSFVVAYRTYFSYIMLIEF